MQWVSSALHTPQVGFRATSFFLSNAKTFPYFLRTVWPDIVTQAPSQVLLARHFKWECAVVVSATDAFSLSGATTFQSEALAQNLKVVRTITFPVEQESFSDIVREIKSADCGFIVAWAPREEYTKLLKEARAQQILKEGYQWLLSDTFQALAPLLRDQLDEFALRGVLATFPSNGVFTPRFEETKTRWAAQERTLRPDGTCTEATDDHPTRPRPLRHVSGATGCAGLEFTESNFILYVPFIYDAVFTVAHALHHLTHVESRLPCSVDNYHSPRTTDRGDRSCFTGAELFDTMMQMQFDGVTGNIAFEPNGDRSTESASTSIYNHDGKEMRVIGSCDGKCVTPGACKCVFCHSTSASCPDIMWPNGELGFDARPLFLLPETDSTTNLWFIPVAICIAVLLLALIIGLIWHRRRGKFRRGFPANVLLAGNAAADFFQNLVRPNLGDNLIIADVVGLKNSKAKEHKFLFTWDTQDRRQDGTTNTFEGALCPIKDAPLAERQATLDALQRNAVYCPTRKTLVVPAFQGTSQVEAKGISHAKLTNLRTAHPNWHGKGMYWTTSPALAAEYALAHGGELPAIVCGWAMMPTPYPIVASDDNARQHGGLSRFFDTRPPGAFGSTYTLVVPHRDMGYCAAPPGVTPTADEIVIFQEDHYLPRAIVNLRKHNVVTLDNGMAADGSNTRHILADNKAMHQVDALSNSLSGATSSENPVTPPPSAITSPQAFYSTRYRLNDSFC
eukprot:NODE_93_length_2492_cov_256.882112_g74_i0.p1 GENE.NODE_93_length_2492_cov_256.882112_g74_i0~~NODE_93_length_2492_cov_256.882112_g74_i0.p1  ORF type:complete len:777 (+),score=148.82 NODE_93_length_2492_cov_256.882112_g74_i0:131-2332(+)